MYNQPYASERDFVERYEAYGITLDSSDYCPTHNHHFALRFEELIPMNQSQTNPTNSQITHNHPNATLKPICPTMFLQNCKKAGCYTKCKMPYKPPISPYMTPSYPMSTLSPISQFNHSIQQHIHHILSSIYPKVSFHKTTFGNTTTNSIISKFPPHT